MSKTHAQHRSRRPRDQPRGQLAKRRCLSYSGRRGPYCSARRGQRRHPQGRPAPDDRAYLQGILSVLHTGDPTGVAAAGVGLRGRHDLLASAARPARSRRVRPAASGAADRVPSGRRTGLVADGDRQLAPARSPGRPKTGPSPVDRGGPGSTDHLITDGNGIPLAVTLTGGDRNDITRLPPLLDAIPHIKGRTGRPRHRPGSRSPTVATTSTGTADCAGNAASSPSSPDATPATARAWGPCAGSSGVRAPGSTASAASACHEIRDDMHEAPPEARLPGDHQQTPPSFVSAPLRRRPTAHLPGTGGEVPRRRPGTATAPEGPTGTRGPARREPASHIAAP